MQHVNGSRLYPVPESLGAIWSQVASFVPQIIWFASKIQILCHCWAPVHSLGSVVMHMARLIP